MAPMQLAQLLVLNTSSRFTDLYLHTCSYNEFIDRQSVERILNIFNCATYQATLRISNG